MRVFFSFPSAVRVLTVSALLLTPTSAVRAETSHASVDQAPARSNLSYLTAPLRNLVTRQLVLHTTLIPWGTRAAADDTRFFYMRRLEGDSSCSGISIGCGFVLTAAHCDLKNARVSAGNAGETPIGRVVESYYPPGVAIPRDARDWGKGELSNNDIQLVKTDTRDLDENAEVYTGAKLIDWNMEPLKLRAGETRQHYVVGYGPRTVEWSEREKAWMPNSLSGTVSSGDLDITASGWFTDVGPGGPRFLEHREGRGRLTTSVTKNRAAVAPGDSGGALLFPDPTDPQRRPKLRGVITSYSAGTKDAGYSSAFAELSGHLPWIYKVMREDGCREVPRVEKLEALRPGKPTLGSSLPAPAAPAPVVETATTRARDLRDTLRQFDLPAVQEQVREARQAAAEFRQRVKDYPLRKTYFEEKADYAERYADAHAALYPELRDRKGPNETWINMEIVTPAVRDRMRQKLAALLSEKLPANKKIIFETWAKRDRDQIELFFAYVPKDETHADFERGVTRTGSVIARGDQITIDLKGGGGFSIPLDR